MITNLNNLPKKNKILANICIIGGGTVGLFLAHRLSLNKIPVTIIEAGEEESKKFKNNNYNSKNYLNKNTLLNERFVVGGKSTVWGGQMLALQKSDVNNRKYINIKAWKIKYKEISKHFPTVMKSLNFRFIKNLSRLMSNKKKGFSFFNRNFDVRFSVFIKPKIKNFCRFFFKDIKNDTQQHIYINSKVSEINNSKNNSSVKNIIAKSNNGNTLEIETKIVIICCGALESTKLLLLYNKKNNNFIKTKTLGRFFCDQLSFICGKFIIKDWKEFNKLFSPIYKYGLIHAPRLELKSKFQKNNKLPSAFCHFIFKHGNDYNLLNNFLKKKLYFKPIKLILFKEIIKIIYHIFYFRILKRYVWFNKPSEVLLSINLEQIPDFNNKIFIKNNRLVTNWKIKKREINDVKLISKTFENTWKESKFNKIAELKQVNLPTYSNAKDLVKILYHPIGTIRIGSKKKESVVDKNLKLWDINNLYVCSTAIFPTSGSSNTGLVLLALTERLATHLRNIIKSKY